MFIEKTANVHQQLVTSWQEQFRDVQRYAVEQQKTHKEVNQLALFGSLPVVD